jgi:hypothetical protein
VAPRHHQLYRAFAEADTAAEQAAANDGLPPRPKPARIRQADEPETPAEAALRRRLQDEVLQRRPGEWPSSRPLLAAALLVDRELGAQHLGELGPQLGQLDRLAAYTRGRARRAAADG